MNIYVSNLSFNVQDEDLREFFTPYGEVSSAKIINDRESGRSRGFGFVEMNDSAAADSAIEKLHGSDLGGRSLTVNEARPMEKREGGFGGVHQKLLDALESLGVEAPCVISLAKREEEVFLPGQSEPLRLSRDAWSLRLLEYVRDEAHRFAQHYHHLLRGKRSFEE